MQNVGQVKSFVDDLVMKLGTVSMRVALVLRSAEVQPVFQDLFIRLLLDDNPPPFSPLPECPQRFIVPKRSVQWAVVGAVKQHSFCHLQKAGGRSCGLGF